jgi:outer membrane immunogenic protein
MRKITTVFAAAAMAAVSTSALAADVSYDHSAAVYDWTGFYLGINGGYVRTRASGLDNFTGGMLGAHAGYNFQYGHWVFGGEIDVARTWNENSYAGGLIEVGTDWQYSLRARMGYAFDRTLLYGTAGLAVTNAYIDIPVIPISINDRMVGWTVGAGVEHAFTDRWSARLEYRYSDYGEFEVLGIGTGIDVTEHTVRVGVSFKF